MLVNQLFDNAGKQLFFGKILTELSGKPLTNEERIELEQVGYLTPGDFKVVKQKYQLLVDCDTSNMNLIQALLVEVSHKHNVNTTKIGF